MTDHAVIPLLLRRTRVPEYLGIGQRTFDRMVSAGKFGPQPGKFGGTVMYEFAEVKRWAASKKNGAWPDRAEWLVINGDTANA